MGFLWDLELGIWTFRPEGDMFDDLTDLYQQVILDHSKSPRNFHKMQTANRTAQGHNPLCGDHVTLFMTMDGDTIKDIIFQGDGCEVGGERSSRSSGVFTDEEFSCDGRQASKESRCRRHECPRHIVKEQP